MGRVLKRVLVGAGVIVVLLLFAAGGMYAVGSSKWSRTYEVETATLELPTAPEEIARGEHVLRTNGCADCHGEDMEGQVMMDAPPFRVVASNLTAGRGGIGASYSVEDLDRAIRNGVRPDGRPLIIMPSAAFHNMSDRDAAALLAYLRTVPPVDNELPETQVKAMGRILAAFSLDPAFEVRTARPGLREAPEKAATAEYGEYLVGITCSYCHGADLRGAESLQPGGPAAPDIVAVAASSSLEAWDRILTTGVRSDGTPMDPAFMPWTLTAAMDPDERQALHIYITGLAN